MHEPNESGQLPVWRRARRGEKGLLGGALLASALVHALAFLTLSFSVPTEPRLPSMPVSRIVHVTPAMQAYDLVQVAGEPAPIEVQVVERAPVMPAIAPRVLPGSRSVDGDVRAPVAAEADPGAVRDRLRYRLTTPQVWQPPSQEIVTDLSPQEVVRQRIAAQLSEYNDSVASESAARERAMDWTVKGEDGKRWGVSPGAIHLGSVTIPVGDTHFAVAAGRREEFAGRVRTWNEIQDQAVREEARGTFKDRVRAIEERMNRERAARGAPPPADPDRKKDEDVKKAADPPAAKKGTDPPQPSGRSDP